MNYRYTADIHSRDASKEVNMASLRLRYGRL